MKAFRKALDVLMCRRTQEDSPQTAEYLAQNEYEDRILGLKLCMERLYGQIDAKSGQLASIYYYIKYSPNIDVYSEIYQIQPLKKQIADLYGLKAQVAGQLAVVEMQHMQGSVISALERQAPQIPENDVERMIEVQLKVKYAQESLYQFEAVANCQSDADEARAQMEGLKAQMAAEDAESVRKSTNLVYEEIRKDAMRSAEERSGENKLIAL